MSGTARIFSSFQITGRGWAIVLTDLSEDFLVKAGDEVTLENGAGQSITRPIHGVEFMDKRDSEGRMTGYVTLILRNCHDGDRRETVGGLASITSN